MTDLSRIKATLEFLKDNQGFNVGGLFVSRTDNVIHVAGSTNYSFVENLNKRIAIKELENTKAEFNEYVEALPEFKDFMKNKEIYHLNYQKWKKFGNQLCRMNTRWNLNLLMIGLT